jgi:hypothetical protein
MSSSTANTYPTLSTTVFAPPAWFTKVSSKSSSSGPKTPDFYTIESDDDPFANFAAVVFAAAEDHDFAYGVTTTATATQNIVSKYKSDTSCLSLINQFWGTSELSPVKQAPTLNLANSRLFRRRAEALAVKAPLAPAGPAVPAVTSVPARRVVLDSANNFANSGLMQRRAAAKAAADAIASS